MDTFYSVKRFIGRQLDDLPKGAIQQVRLSPHPPHTFANAQCESVTDEPAQSSSHVLSSMSLMSSNWSHSQITAVQVPYLVDSDQDGDVVLKCDNVEGGQLYPEEVSGQVLSYMLAHAEQAMQASISKAVISVCSLSSGSACYV